MFELAIIILQQSALSQNEDVVLLFFNILQRVSKDFGIPDIVLSIAYVPIFSFPI